MPEIPLFALIALLCGVLWVAWRLFWPEAATDAAAADDIYLVD